jgi:hypothetical protein
MDSVFDFSNGLFNMAIFLHVKLIYDTLQEIKEKINK